jgi:hypothetical protein
LLCRGDGGFVGNRLGRRRAIGDAVSNKIVVANANCLVRSRHNAGRVLVTKEIDTHISWNTLEGTPLDWHRVRDIPLVGENGIVARSTAALEFLGRVIVDTE